MRFRKLRIVWSVFCGIACVLLIVLWVRSYWWVDIVNARLADTRSLQAISCYGKFAVIVAHYSGYWHYECSPSSGYAWRIAECRKFSFIRLVPRTSGRQELAVSYHLCLLSTAILSGVSWLRWRYGLRTLLIATTLVAVVLGIIVWMSQAG
jgi:hypothetical protein